MLLHTILLVVLHLGITVNCQCATGCNDTCCDAATETCCPDPKEGSVCCILETTFCCPPAPQFGFPSRCCPRWMVCCPEGKYGCCENPSLRDNQIQEVKSKFAKNEVHTLYELSEFDGDSPMFGVTVDLTNGNRKETQIQGPFNDWGEITRVFTYDPTRDAFYLPQANFSDPAQAITLYTISTIAGAGTGKVIQGASHQVTGFVFHRPSRNIIMSTYAYQGTNKIGYNFYTVDPTTAVAKFVSSFLNSNGADSYAGWNFHDVSANGNLIFRLGHKDPSKGDIFGLSVVDISKTTASMSFFANFTIPSGYTNYISFSLFGRSPDFTQQDFLSLTTSTGVLTEGELSLVRWNLNGTVEVFASFGNANLPPYFGPVVPFLTSDLTTYVTAAVYDDPLDSNLDRWEICVVDLTSKPGGSSRNVIMFPWLLGGTDSASGVGIPDSE